MYIDARKFKYPEPHSEESLTKVKRDKAHSKHSYARWVDSNIDKFIERLWEIEDIGVVERFGEFIKLLKEAEFTYSLGIYKSTIALIGISAEDLCRFFASISGHNLDSLSQNDRINKLQNLGLLTDKDASDMHSIRQIRNDCLHFNQNFKSKSEDTLKSDALTAINTLKQLYARLVGATSYNQVTPDKLNDIISVIASEVSTGSHDGVKNMADASIRLRNIFSEVTGLDLSLNAGHQPIIKRSRYVVLETDLDDKQPEITLFDMLIGCPLIVDVDEELLDPIKRLSLSQGQEILASICSITSGLGMSETWAFAEIPQLLEE